MNQVETDEKFAELESLIRAVRTEQDDLQAIVHDLQGNQAANADTLQRVRITSTKPTSNQVLVYNGTTQLWTPTTIDFSYVSAIAPLQASASGSLTLTNSYQDVAGATVTLNRTGKWVIFGLFDLAVVDGAGNDDGQVLTGRIDVNGTYDGLEATYRGEGNPELDRGTVSQIRAYTAASQPLTAKLQAKKAAGTGSSLCVVGNTTITAVFLGV